MALKVGDLAPDFKLPAVIGEKQEDFQLSAHRGKKIVLLFYALDFTPVCSAELPPFEKDLAALSQSGALVVGISTDSIFSHAAFQKSLGGLNFPLASDRWPYAETAKAYGLFPAAKHQFGGVNDRAVFVIGRDAKIAWMKVYELGDQPKVGEVLAALKSVS